MGFFSEALAEMDRNTVDYMIDTLRKNNERLQGENEKLREEIAQMREELEKYKN